MKNGMDNTPSIISMQNDLDALGDLLLNLKKKNQEIKENMGKLKEDESSNNG